MVYAYEYDLNYLPAMPMVTIQIGKPDGDTFVTLSALVDSGADATMIPVNHLKAVHAIKRQHVFIWSVARKRAGGQFVHNISPICSLSSRQN